MWRSSCENSRTSSESESELELPEGAPLRSGHVPCASSASGSARATQQPRNHPRGRLCPSGRCRGRSKRRERAGTAAVRGSSCGHGFLLGGASEQGHQGLLGPCAPHPHLSQGHGTPAAPGLTEEPWLLGMGGVAFRGRAHPLQRGGLTASISAGARGSRAITWECLGKGNVCRV